jgi:DNA polymerase I-like protein with 3'-5' exonuclease and polymerase domains
LKAERQAINTIIQGSAADLVKTAMVKIGKALDKIYLRVNEKENNKNQRGASLIIQLHDELIFDVNEADFDDVKRIVQDCMENCIDLAVKMKVKLKSGKNWGSLK